MSLFAPSSGLQRLWRRLATPIEPAHAADALVGVRPAPARRLLAVALATSPEADQLLEQLPVTLRSLAVSTASVPIRCDGEVRGPVLWSATVAARSSSPGAGGVFICASPTRAYDTDENRVLVAALTRLLRAARTAETDVEDADPRHRPPSADLRRARHNGELARRALEHHSLQVVGRIRPTGRMLQKTRTGTKANVFRHAVSLLERSWAAVGAEDLAPFVDQPTRASHVVAADVVDVLVARGLIPGRLHVVDGQVVGGPFTYAHLGGEAVAGGATPGVAVDGRRLHALSDLDL